MDNIETTESLPPARPGPWRSILRRVVYPLAVIAIIAGVIWWLEYRDDSATSPTGERYGPADLPAAMVPAGADVAAEEGALAPDFLLEELEEGEVRLSDFRGSPVVLNFWATWCAPCRQEIPHLVNAYDQYRDEGLVVIGLNMQEGKSIVRPYAEDFGMEFPILVDRDGEVGDEYRVLGMPVTYFIDADGVIQSVFLGPLIEEGAGANVQGAIEESELDQRIAEILSAEPAGAD